MKNDIPILIKKLLKEVGEVHVSGLGTFSRTVESAVISPDRQSIRPPRYKITFDGSQKSTDVFTTYVAEHLRVGRHEAERRIADFVHSCTDALLERGEYTVAGVGQLSKFGEQLLFVDAFSEQERAPSVNIRPVRRLKQEAVTPIFKNYEEESSSPWYLWLVLLGLIGLTVLSWRSCYGGSTTQIDDRKEKVEDVEMLTSSVDSSLIGSGANTPSQIKNKYGQTIPASKKCVIITGSLKKSRNVVRMEALLMKKGYTVHKSVHNGLTRIGITFECMDKNLEDYVQDIRKTIDPKAWYLDPELEVASK